jgi:16S rRNA (uracil1498-N3)-methyltransferase
MTENSPDSPKRRMPLTNLKAGSHRLSRDESRYLLKALRLAEGERIEVFDGQGFFAMATLQGVDSGEPYLDIQQPQEAPKPAHELFIAVATPKGDRADWLVEKITEIGAAGLIWLQTQRSVVTPKPGSKKFERWARIADAAARQSRRVRVPQIEGPLSLKELCNMDFDHRLVASPIRGEHAVPKTALQGRSVVVIGPEGGFTDDELEQMKNSGYNLLWLSPHILRTETAAIAAAAVLIAHPS